MGKSLSAVGLNANGNMTSVNGQNFDPLVDISNQN